MMDALSNVLQMTAAAASVILMGVCGVCLCVRLTRVMWGEESASGLIALRIRMVYEAGRDDAVKLFLERAQLLEYIKGLGDSRAKLMDFAHYMEALVAYSKKEGIPEREYLNTLRFARDSKGKTRLDAVSSLLRGVLVSDSEPIPNNAMTLTGKRDAAFGGEVNAGRGGSGQNESLPDPRRRRRLLFQIVGLSLLWRGAGAA